MNNKPRTSSLAGTILLAGLIAGTLDGTAAVITSGKMSVFNFVASGVFGKEALDGSTNMMIYGILFHYLIAFVWTIIYFLLYPRIAIFRYNPIVSAILYGLIIWIVMNRVVLPLANTPPIPFRWISAVRGAAILMVAIGLPVAFIARRYYSGK